MSIYFNRTIPLYLESAPSFDGIKVDVPVKALKTVEALRALIEQTEQDIVEAAAPERSNQLIAESFVEGLDVIFKTKGKK